MKVSSSTTGPVLPPSWIFEWTLKAGYVLELSSAAGNPSPGAGRILRITGTLVEEIVSGLFVPTGMVLDQHGDIYVSDLGAAA